MYLPSIHERRHKPKKIEPFAGASIHRPNYFKDPPGNLAISFHYCFRLCFSESTYRCRRNLYRDQFRRRYRPNNSA